LVELLVVISIIGMLAALLLPAVQQAREAARSAQCRSRMRQVAIAAIAFEGTHQRFPGYTNDVGLQTAPWIVPLLPHLDGIPTFNNWKDATTDFVQTGSTGLWDLLNPASRLSPYLPVLYCPSAQSADVTLPVSTMVANAGYIAIGGEPGPRADNIRSERSANGVFVNRSVAEWAEITVDCGSFTTPPPLPKVAVSDLIDGASNTLLFSENITAPPASPFRFWTFNGKGAAGVLSAAVPGDGTCAQHASGYNVFTYLYASEDLTTTGVVVPPLPPPATPLHPISSLMRINGLKDSASMTTSNLASTLRPSSEHPGGVNIVFADGNTRFISEDIAYYVYQQLMTGKSVSSDVPYPGHTLDGQHLQ
jgi:prepilin-type processing-associated H-X9-DG protein